MKHWLLAAYCLLGALLVVQTFTHGYMDQSIELLDAFYLSEGMTPYVDFFEHHPVFQNMFLAPAFWLTGPSMTVLLVYDLLAIAGVLLCAWLVFRIARDSRLPNPHAASLFFLVGYTGLAIPFLRYDFWAMLFLLAFFAAKRPVIRGFWLAMLAATGPITLFASVGMGLVWLVSAVRRSRRDAGMAVLGGLVAFIGWCLAHAKVPFSALYYGIFTFNSLVAHLYTMSWKEITFFSLFFTVPVIALGGWIAWKRMRENETARLALVFAGIFIVQIILMNIIYGAFSRIKLPAPVPLIALMCVFIAGYRWKHAVVFIAAQLLLTLFVFTPSLAFPQLGLIEAGQTLDRCVAADATFVLEEDPHTGVVHVPLFRRPAEYHWFVQYLVKDAGIPYQAPALAAPVSLCGNVVERSALTCGDATITQLQTSCEHIRIPETLWLKTRAAISP